jgi:hypothetical protein
MTAHAGDRLPKGQIKVKTVIAIAFAMMVVGPLASATVWGVGTFGLGSGSVSWSSQDVSANGDVVQLGGSGSQANLKEPTVAAVHLGNSGGQVSSQTPASGALQLSGYYENMGNYKNIYYSAMMLGGTFSSGGHGGCCGG